MEVILPSNFDKNYLLYDRSVHAPVVTLSCDENGRRDCGSIIKHLYLLDVIPARTDYNNNERHYTIAPPKAIWYTKQNSKQYVTDSYQPDLFISRNPGHGMSNTILPNLVRPLADIPMKKEPFSGFPESDYCVIQNEDDYNAFQLNNIGDYPITAPSIIEFLNSHLSAYNGEQAYKIIRRQVMLVKLVGKTTVKSKEFQQLLLVDCKILEQEINKLATNLQLGLYRCSIVERQSLLEALHLKLIGNEFLNKNVPAPLTTAISTQADKLIMLVNQLRDITNATEEINRLREALMTTSDDKDSINKQFIDSSNTIAELRASNHKANSEIDKQNSEISAHIIKVKSLETQIESLVNTEKSLNSIIRNLKDENSKLIKRVNILEINAAKDEALIFNLRAEKAHWNSNSTKSFEDEQRRSKEIQELKNRINELL